MAELERMKRINFLEGDLKNGDFVSADETVTIPLGASYEGPVSLGVRPESIRIGTGGGLDLSVAVTYIEPLGSSEKVFVKAGRNELRAVVEADAEVKIGDTLTITFLPKDIFLFEAQTGRRLSTD
ncbi:MAG: TOBE domain-containing protein [Candidatus Hodarchaeota archaeon]